MGILTQLYKSLFGKKYQAVWKQFAKDHNGTFILANDGNNDGVIIFYQDFKIIFDSYTHIIVVGSSSTEIEFTRVKVELSLADNLKFKLLRKGFVDSIGKLFGAQDIVIGDREFDKAFLIKGNNDFKIQQLFSNTSIRKLVLSQKDIRLEMMDTIGVFDEKIQDGNSLLYFISEDRIKNIEQLNSLYRLFSELLNQLLRISSAKPRETTS
jgi:hypothetical protein